jgi:hypothetical protein
MTELEKKLINQLSSQDLNFEVGNVVIAWDKNLTNRIEIATNNLLEVVRVSVNNLVLVLSEEANQAINQILAKQIVQQTERLINKLS